MSDEQHEQPNMTATEICEGTQQRLKMVRLSDPLAEPILDQMIKILQERGVTSSSPHHS